VLLQKTLLAIEGLGRLLYPELDLWKTARPTLEDWMRQRRDPRTQLKQFVEAWPEISEDLALLPRLLHRAIRRAEKRDAEEQRAGRMPRTRVREPGRHLSASGGVLVIAGVLWLGLVEPKWPGGLGLAFGLVLLFMPRTRGA
jgi:ubiquinone biosynthesis protein